MKITNSKSIAGVIVLYNPDDSVCENVKSYLDNLLCLYVIDNSEKQNLVVVNELKKKDKVYYFCNQENLGIASALNVAAKKAIDEGYDFILTMDQDSYFEGDSFLKLLKHIEPREKIAIYSPFHKNKFFTKPPKLSEPEEVSDVMTSGNILNLSAFLNIGMFNDSYFIDYVDTEYCLRVRKDNYKILRINDSILIHNEANLEKKFFFGKMLYPPNHNELRWYYKVRNYFYLKKEYAGLFPDYFINENKNIRNNILKIVFFEKQKIKKLKMIFKGYLHFKRNIVGKLA